jgi:DNA-binding winged helix-turn-helix (wHTH) protein
METGIYAESSSTHFEKEPSLVFEVFELIQEEPPQLWRIDRNSRHDVHLTPLETRLLVFLAQRPMRWVTIESLADHVWNDSELGGGSIHVAVSRLRKKLIGFEHLIESGTSTYRLNANVSTRTELTTNQIPPVARIGRPKRSPFTVNWHVLAPFFPGGAPLANPAKGVTKSGELADSTVYKTQDPNIVLTWYDYGAAVWVMTRQRSFPSITSLAQERESYYRAFLRGDHTIRKLTKQIQQAAAKGSRISPSTQSMIGYALSVIGVEEMAWRPDEVDHALKLLSCPNLLSGYATVEHGDVQENRPAGQFSSTSQQEADFLRRGIPMPEARPFSLVHTVRGYASWAGVSYHLPCAQRPVFEPEFIRYETRLQAFWLFLDHHIKLLEQGAIRAIARETKQQAQTQARLVFGAEPREHTPVRLFKEAVMASSRIGQLWETFQQHF